ncbi:hypothetical protein [Streptomyces prunicolor]|jgi:hypothetical protein|uniref:hypothetical protein n=1 Tax=Streptomyces prunicolor TaxID=67348 RepID=UPI00036B4133|nr:hypothetical protein [Streptomyces prunicolor]MCX5237834.1 hypothetical protein [Streptomyces prunicolor]
MTMHQAQAQHDGEQPQDVAGAMAQYLGDMGTRFTNYANQLHRLSQQRQGDLGQLRNELREQDAQLNNLLQLHNQLRVELSGAAEERHHTLAAGFKDLVQLKVVPTCMTVEAYCPSTHEIDMQKRRMILVRLLCRLLFGALPAMNSEVRDLFRPYAASAGPGAEKQAASLAEPLCAEVNALRAAIAETGTAFRWDFEVRPGSVYSPDKYQLWQTASEQAPIRHVVIPAYVVPGRPPYVRATVFTALAAQFGTPVQRP